MSKSRSSRSRSSRPAAARKAAKSTPSKAAGLIGPAGPAARLPGGVQRKIAVGPADDAYEREADAVADRVTRGEAAPTVSRIPPSGLPAQRATEDVGEQEEAQTLQREEASNEEEEEAAQTAQRAEKKAEDDAEEAQTLQRAEKEAEESSSEEEAQTLQRQQEGEEEEAAQTLQREGDEKSKQEQEGGASEEIPSEEEAVKGAAQTEQKGEEEEPEVQTKSRRNSSPQAMSAAAEQAVAEKDEGEPLDPGLQRSMESSMRADLSDVRVHRGARAERASDALNARAFTHGKDVWLGRGESARDPRLMAHETAHVLQQTRRIQHPVAQRNGENTSSSSGGAALPNPLEPETAGRIDTVNKTIDIPSLRLPSVANKQKTAGPLIAVPPGDRQSDQRSVWLQNIKGAGVSTKVDEMLPDSKAIPSPNGEKLFYLKLKTNSFLVGNKETIKAQARLPNWNSDGKNQNYEVDHVHEAQLKGPHKIDNFQLLDPQTNSASGRAIADEISDKIDDAVKPHVGEGKFWPAKPKSSDVRRQFKVTFGATEGTLPLSAGKMSLWTLNDVQNQGSHLDVLEVLDAAKIDKLKVPLVGSETHLAIYASPSAGQPRKIQWKDGKLAGSIKSLAFKGFDPTDLTYAPGSGGSLIGNTYKKNKVVTGTGVTIPIEEFGGLQYTGRLMTTSVKNQLKLSAKGASPITINDAYLTDESLVVVGQVNLTPRIFKGGLTVDITLDGDDVTLSKTFASSDFDFPGPIKVTDASLTLSAGTAGLKAEGDVNFEIERVGQGKVSGIGDISGGFGVEGQFDFDKKLFNDADASVKVRYAEQKLSGEGTLKIGADKVKGVKSATVTVKIDDQIWTAEGIVEPDVPGVQEGSLAVKFDPNGGMEITGKLTLGEGVPRLKSGSIEAKVTQNGDEYSVEGKGSAELDIPGAAAAVTAEYKDGFFKAEAKLGYEKGIAKGSITAGVTNMPVGDDGKPSGDPGDELAVYGQGSVTVRFTPWLEGTAGIKIDPAGKMEVTGKVALPDSVEVFPEKKIEKELLSVGVDIPIVGVAVAGQRIGIFLNISGSLTARAAIGPGTLKDVSVEVTFDPEDESSAHITGSARFVVPADAGLKLGISGSLGAGIPVVSARAGLEVSGELGIKGEASASATVEWTPQTGIDLAADVSVKASPNFTFAITGFVDVSADLLIDTVELYHKNWNLASVEYGSGLTFGAKLPVKIERGELKDISVDDIQFTVPDVDPIDVAKGLIDKIT